MNLKRYGLAGLVILVLFWAGWSLSGRSHSFTSEVLELEQVYNISGDANCERNVVGIQPFMKTEDYLSEEKFQAKMSGYFEEARKAGFLRKKTIVLLPEYLGTWLVINGEKESVAGYADMQSAMGVMILSNPINFFRYYLDHGDESDKVAASLFRMKSGAMAEIYGRVFRNLASSFNVTIVAGSIVLPGPAVQQNEIVISSKQPLYNASFVFYPDGSIDPHIVLKSYPIGSELPFLESAPIDSLPLFHLQGTSTAILVCADSWYPDSYKMVDSLDAALVLVPSYCTGDGTMAKKWKGYDGGAIPADVDRLDVGKINEGEAWVRYALPGRIARCKAKTGVNVFLRGQLWDLGSDGQPFFVRQGQLLDVPGSEKAGIWNLCF
ncbi:MAG: carbon-nitrogen hydrolase [Bacteroidetes bacterium]|nr:carbon-nitrogen hydrolase [Bacteroidota bacterium]